MNIEPKNDSEKANEEISEPQITPEENGISVKEPKAESPTEDKNKKEKNGEKEKNGKKEKAPKISSELVDQGAVEGSEVKFTCKVKGTPTPEVEWLRDGKKIQPSDLFIITSDGERHSLIIKNVTVDFTGTYAVKVNKSSIKSKLRAHNERCKTMYCLKFE